MNECKRRTATLVKRLNQDPHLQALFDDHAYGPDIYNAIFAEKRVTPAGRMRAPIKLCEETAEYLDLADDAVKAALFALVETGVQVGGYVRHTVALKAQPELTAEFQATEASAVAAAAAQEVLGLRIECEWCAERA